jgi:hypothetical protein
MPVGAHNSAYMSVYQVVEALCSSASPPAGLSATMGAALDGLRRIRAPRAEIGTAERIAIAMHRLEVAVRSGEATTQTELRVELRALRSEWLDTPLCTH